MDLLPRFLILAACILALLTLPLPAQDDNNAPAPQPDNGAPAPDDGSAAPEAGVTFQTFYDALSNQGNWIQSNDYGYVWQPTETDPEWAPYTEGHWVYTDAGWTWVSTEPWGWATYHYGRWVNLEGTGWCWVPGYTWAPAWVSWRYGDGYAGWAPLPPDSFVGIDYTDDGDALGAGFHIGGDCDGFYGIGPGWYSFLPIYCLGYASYHGYYCHRGDNYAIINHTTNVTNINVTNGRASGGAFHHVTTGGPMLAQVNAATATPIQRVSLVRASQPAGGGTLNGNSLALFAPRVASGATSQPANVTGTIGTASINRGTDIMRPLAVNSRMSVEPATEAQVQQARIAQDHAPANAKVMIDDSQVRPILQAPLTTMRAVASSPSTSRIFNPPITGYSHTERTPSVYNAAPTPTVRVYPQTSEQENAVPRTTYQGPVTSPGATPNQPVTHTYVHSATPAPAPTATVVHQTTSGYSNGGNHSTSSSGTGNGSYHSGNGSSQSH